MSSHVFPLPPGVLSQPHLTVFPGGPGAAPPAPGIIQLAQQECADLVLPSGDQWRFPTSGVGAGVEGPWEVHILSTIRENKWFGICFANDFITFDRFVEFDIGVGAAGLEVPFMDDLGFSWLGQTGGSGGTALGVMYTGAFVTPIPAASRVSVRVKDDKAGFAIGYRSLLFLMSE
jgi:hypothetical protein